MSVASAEHGGLWPALVSLVPELANGARVTRPSTSAGVYRADTSQPFSGSGGEHVFVMVRNGSDIECFLRTLLDCCFRHVERLRESLKEEDLPS
jgi:hypothetical protein